MIKKIKKGMSILTFWHVLYLLEQRGSLQAFFKFLIKKQNVPEIIEILVVEPMLVTRSRDVPLDLA